MLELSCLFVVCIFVKTYKLIKLYEKVINENTR